MYKHPHDFLEPAGRPLRFRKSGSTVSLVLHYLELTRITFFSLGILVLNWCLKKRRMRTYQFSLLYYTQSGRSWSALRGDYLLELRVFPLFLFSPISWLTNVKCSDMFFNCSSMDRLHSSGSRLQTFNRCSVQGRSHLCRHLLLSLEMADRSLRFAYVCRHCVACIALSQADANTFFIIPWFQTGAWRRSNCALYFCVLVIETMLDAGIVASRFVLMHPSVFAVYTSFSLPISWLHG